jgi:hypothetical protein
MVHSPSGPDFNPAAVKKIPHRREGGVAQPFKKRRIRSLDVAEKAAGQRTHYIISN